MNDLISRQAVEDLIMETDPWWCEGMTRAILEGVKRLPSAQQERTGRWSQVSGQATLCSCCGRASNAKQERNWSYCPYCGEKMEEME
ncbi:MAG: hypothetical protein IJR95_04480 [Lachnospiraceae bacterium]|nr:hypothetical protein [Lachnospiraceae bacterium]